MRNVFGIAPSTILATQILKHVDEIEMSQWIEWRMTFKVSFFFQVPLSFEKHDSFRDQ